MRVSIDKLSTKLWFLSIFLAY